MEKRKERFFEITEKGIRIYDAETSLRELVVESAINFLWGFTANFMTPFIAMRVDWCVLIGFVWYYFVISQVLNRKAYTTKLGRYIVMPIPAAIGAYASYLLGYAIIDWLK